MKRRADPRLGERTRRKWRSCTHSTRAMPRPIPAIQAPIAERPTAKLPRQKLSARRLNHMGCSHHGKEKADPCGPAPLGLPIDRQLDADAKQTHYQDQELAMWLSGHRCLLLRGSPASPSSRRSFLAQKQFAGPRGRHFAFQIISPRMIPASTRPASSASMRWLMAANPGFEPWHPHYYPTSERGSGRMRAIRRGQARRLSLWHFIRQRSDTADSGRS